MAVFCFLGRFFIWESTSVKKIGDLFETQITEILQSEGWKIVERNLHNQYGELDIVIQKEQILGIVEVKGRNQESPWNDEVLSPTKKARLIRCSNLFLSECSLDFDEVIFVVVLIEKGDIVMIWDAFEAE